MEFPRLVFKKDGANACQGGSYDHKLVEDDKDYAAALSAGWHASIPDALSVGAGGSAGAAAGGKGAGAGTDTQAGDPPADGEGDALEDTPPTRKELKEQAASLGLEYDGRIGDKKLRALIDAALAE